MIFFSIYFNIIIYCQLNTHCHILQTRKKIITLIFNFFLYMRIVLIEYYKKKNKYVIEEKKI